VGAPDPQAVTHRYPTRPWRMRAGNFFQLIRYGAAEAQGSWRDADRVDGEIQQVTAEDVQRVAKEYFTKENRAVAIWTRLASAEPEDPALAGLSPQGRQMVQRSLGRLDGMTEPGQVQEMLGRLDQMGDRLPPDMKPAMDYVRAKAQEKLTQLQKEGQ
jgi:hypothetical protein